MPDLYDNKEQPRGAVIEVGLQDNSRHAIVLDSGLYSSTFVRYHIALMGTSKVEVYRFANETSFRVALLLLQEDDGR